jgi:prepilin-type N-terminal cleavage/methylation domain-containing protein
MKERGFTLVELMVVLLIASLSTGMLAHSLLARTKRSADLDAVKTLLNLAARRSVVEAKHFGVHFDSTLHTAGLFEDRNNDDHYNGTDTLATIARLYPLSTLRVSTTAAVAMSDVCFKKNGATSSGNSFELNYLGARGDTTKMQIIAASGRLIGP